MPRRIGLGLALVAALIGPALGSVLAADDLRPRYDLLVGRSGYDQLAGIAVRPDGSAIAAGSTFINAADLMKGWAAKANSDGSRAWELVFVEHFRSRMRAVAAFPDGDALLAGSIWQDAEKPSLAFVARIDGDGRVRWAKAYGGPSADEASGIVATASGGAVVVGYTTLESAPAPVGWAFAIDGAGNRLWETTFDSEPLTGVAALPDGDIAVVGMVRHLGTAPDAWAARLSPDGDLRWQRRIGGAEHDSAAAVIAAPDDGILIGGETLSKGAGGADAWLLELDSAGALRWDDTFGGAGTDRFSALAWIDGRIVAAGTTQIPETDDFQFWVALVDRGGGPIKTVILGGNRDDRALGLAAGRSGFAVAGMAQPADENKLIADGRMLFFELP